MDDHTTTCLLAKLILGLLVAIGPLVGISAGYAVTRRQIPQMVRALVLGIPEPRRRSLWRRLLSIPAAVRCAARRVIVSIRLRRINKRLERLCR